MLKHSEIFRISGKENFTIFSTIFKHCVEVVQNMISIGSNAVKIMACNLYFRLPRRYFMVIATLSTGHPVFHDF